MFTRLIRKSCMPIQQRNFATLVLAEHRDGKLNGSIGSVMTAAGLLNDSHVDVLVHGADCEAQISQVQKYAGAKSVLVA
jgi:electron transfer flavoprotein alpha subunit